MLTTRGGLPTFARRGQSEITLLKKLRHPNIVKYVDSFPDGDFLDIVLEYVENGSLAQTIKKFGVFSEKLSAIYVSQVRLECRYAFANASELHAPTARARRCCAGSRTCTSRASSTGTSSARTC